MEMKINAEKVIHERKIRAWSQQHLADASAVSLRTIQRVENNGSGSLETIKSLASCFELDVSGLFETEVSLIKNQSNINPKAKSKIVAIFSFIIALLSSVFFLTPSSMASDVIIKSQKMQVSANKEYRVYSNNVEIFLPNKVVFEVLIDSKWETETPSIASGSVKIYLEHSVVFIDKAIITRVASGTKITTDYAKFTKL